MALGHEEVKQRFQAYVRHFDSAISSVQAAILLPSVGGDLPTHGIGADGSLAHSVQQHDSARNRLVWVDSFAIEAPIETKVQDLDAKQVPKEDTRPQFKISESSQHAVFPPASPTAVESSARAVAKDVVAGYLDMVMPVPNGSCAD